MSDTNTISLNGKDTARESGFYWCNYMGHWVICQYCVIDDWWDIPGMNNNTVFEDSNFKEIDERRIVREEPVTPKISGTTKRTPQNE